MLINLDFEQQNLQSTLKGTAREVEFGLKLYKKQDAILENVNTVAEETINELYKNFNVNNEEVTLNIDINADNYLNIDKSLFKDFNVNGWANNFENINHDNIKKILTDTVTKQIDLDTDNNVISKDIASKMKEEVKNAVDKEYASTINKLKGKDNKTEQKIKSNFEMWNNAYNNKDLENMKQQAINISTNMKQYINADKDIVYNATYIISKTKYLEEKNNNKNNLEMSNIEEELLKKFVNEELHPEAPISEELQNNIDKYTYLAEREYSLDEQRLQEMNKLYEEIQAQAKIENVRLFLDEPDTTQLEKILKKLEEGI